MHGLACLGQLTSTYGGLFSPNPADSFRNTHCTPSLGLGLDIKTKKVREK
jgi:hypothetical protein